VPLVLSLAELLDRLKLPHAFGGALANNYWGVVRATQDIDLLILLPALRYQEVATAFADGGFSMRSEDDRPVAVEVALMRRQTQDRRMFALYDRDGIKVEVFVPVIPLQDEILKRAVRLPFEGRPIPVTTAEDLILLKMAFHRDKDLRDVRGILATQKGTLDTAYLLSWIGRMLEDRSSEELRQWMREYGAG
jgi:predicted nucleotidyltransferase